MSEALKFKIEKEKVDDKTQVRRLVRDGSVLCEGVFSEGKMTESKGN